MPERGAQSTVRLAELVAALSLGIDLGFGQPMEHVLRQTLIAMRLAELMGLAEQAKVDVYYTALLVNVGCHSDAYEQAKWFGDDIEMKTDKYDYEFRSIRGALAGIRRIGAGQTPLHRARTSLDFAIHGMREAEKMITQHAALARRLADELQLPNSVGAALAGSYERWDGRGWPGALAGDDIPIASRLAQLAEYVEVTHRVGGVGAALELAQRRSATQFDPKLAALLADNTDVVLGSLEAYGSWNAVIDAEPTLGVCLSETEFDDALAAIAMFVDLKSPYTLGHSRAVAELAVSAGHALDLSDDELRDLRRAGFVHGFGRLGVSNAIWDKPGPLGAGEWERVRMHPYYTKRMLQQSDALGGIGRIAVQLRERLDGSGYPRGLRGSSISRPARVLAAADAYQAMGEPRPYRPERSNAEAAQELRDEVRAGRLDSASVEAVLTAAGHRVRRRRDGPAGLTAREVEVLKLVARGCSNKQIAQRLVISPKTASNHIEHIYSKIGASNRAGASLFAMQQGLLPEDEYTAKMG
jgi:HD-GYP domain-containing protein (c-di-GMP phosphodiesterase class II)